MDYKEAQLAMLDYLLKRHKQETSFRFSLRNNFATDGSSGLFIGTDKKTSYFGFTLWSMFRYFIFYFLLLSDSVSAQSLQTPNKHVPPPSAMQGWITSIWYAITHFLDAKGADLIVTFIGTLLGFIAAIWLYRRQVADADASDKRKAVEALVTEKRQAAEAMAAESRRVTEAFAAERRQAAEVLAAEKRQAIEVKQVEIQAIQQRRIEHVRWLTGILKQVINHANGQADEMEKFVAKLTSEPSEIHQLAAVANSSIQRLTRADNEATFHAYNTIFSEDPDKDKNYGALLGITDFIALSISGVQESFQRYLKNLYNRHLQIKSMLEEAANNLATLKLSMDPGGPQAGYFNSDFHQQVNHILLVYSGLIVRSRPLKELLRDFVNPLIKVLLEKPHFAGSNDLIIKLKNLNVAFTDLQFESTNFQQAFDPNKLREPAQRLEVVREKLEKGYENAETILKGPSGE